MNFYNWLLQERQEINISKKIWNDLSFRAQIALEEWEISNWDKGKLTRHISNNDEIAKEIIITFKPIREYLKNKFGKTITLYRGMIKNDREVTNNKEGSLKESKNPEISVTLKEKSKLDIFE